MINCHIQSQRNYTCCILEKSAVVTWAKVWEVEGYLYKIAQFLALCSVSCCGTKKPPINCLLYLRLWVESWSSSEWGRITETHCPFAPECCALAWRNIFHVKALQNPVLIVLKQQHRPFLVLFWQLLRMGFVLALWPVLIAVRMMCSVRVASPPESSDIPRARVKALLTPELWDRGNFLAEKGGPPWMLLPGAQSTRGCLEEASSDAT